MNIHKRLLHFIRPHKIKLILAIFSTLVISGIDGITAWLVKPVVDDIFIRKDVYMLKFLSITIVLLYILKGGFKFASSFLMSSMGHNIVMDLRNALFKHTQTLSSGFFTDSKVGGLISRIINDISAIQGLVSIAIKDLLRESFTIIVLTCVLFYRDWKLAIISIIALPGSAFFLIKVSKRLRQLGKSGQEKIADISSMLVEAFSGHKVIKAFCREDYITEKFKLENTKFLKIMLKTIKYKELTSPFMEFIGAIGLSLIIWYGGNSVIVGTSTAGNFFSFITALLMLYTPIRRLSNINNNIQHAYASASRIFELLEIKTEIVEKKNAVILKSFSTCIEIDKVSFSYDSNSSTVLQNISLKIKKGEVIAIVGKSGVGKSTLLHLLPRFYDVSEGLIKIDNIDIKDFTINSLRSNFGIVTQDTFLFNDTIKNNISFGDEKATDEKIIEAASLSYSHDFIMRLPQKYDTVIGERGIKLSGGEKQRIAIARALYKNPAIMILDEATSALDTESENKVQQALNNLMKDRTSFVIAHRFSTILNADKIVVLVDGKIAEVGKHKDLLKKEGAYKRVFDMQFAR